MQLIAEINFISLKPGSDEMRVMYTRSDNEEFKNGDDTDEVIKSLFKSFLQRFEENLQEKMRGQDFEFDSIKFSFYNFNRTSIYRGGSYIDSPKWLNDKKSRIKMGTCQNNPNKSSTTKINKHTPSGYSIFTSCSFDESKNKINYYRGDDCMKEFCKDLREHTMKIINYEKKGRFH